MTPKEKAKELVSKFKFLTYPESDAKFYNPKQCALIAVDEIIRIEKNHMHNLWVDYWQEVKQELMKSE